MLGRIAGGVFLIILMFAFSSNISAGIKNLRTDQVVRVQEVITAPAETTGAVTLVSYLFADNLVNVTSVTSSELTDTPIASNYDYATNTLTISGLDDDLTRDITVNYLAPIDDDFWAALGPFLGFLVFGGIIAAIVYSIWKPSRR